MQQYAGVYLLQNHSTCFGCLSFPSSGVHKTNCSLLYSNNLPATWPIGHVGGRLLLRCYDLYQRLQLQIYVLLIMGTMDTRNV